MARSPWLSNLIETWFPVLRKKGRHGRVRAKTGARLRFEALEDRTLLSGGLTLQNPAFDTSLAYPGEQISVTGDVHNGGTSAASNVQVHYYLNTSPTSFSPADAIGTATVGSISAGGDAPATLAYFLPSAEPVGTYYLHYDVNGINPGSDPNSMAVVNATTLPGFGPVQSLVGVNQTPTNQNSGGMGVGATDAKVASDANGNYVVTWQVVVPGTSGPSSGGVEIWARLFTANGTPSGGQFRVDTLDSTPILGTATAKFDPTTVPWDVAMDGSGSFVVVWSNETVASGDRLQYHVFNANGSPVNGTQTVVFSPSSFAGGLGSQFAWGADTLQARPVVAMDSAGKFVIAAAGQTANFGFNGLYTIHFDSAGNQGAAVEVAGTETSSRSQEAPGLAMKSDGSLILVWSDVPTAQVLAQRFDAVGNTVGSVFEVNGAGAATGNALNPEVAADAAGDFVVAWQETYSGGGTDRFARRFDSSGNPLATPVKLTTTPTANASSFSDHSLAVDAAGNFVIGWSDSRFGVSGGFVGQAFAANGLPAGGLFFTAHFPANFAFTGTTGQFEAAWANEFGNVKSQTFAFTPLLTLAPNIVLVPQGQSYVDSFTIADPTDGPWTVEVDYGDGSAPVDSSSSSPVVALGHSYTTPGNYVVTVTATNPAGGTRTGRINVDLVPSPSVPFVTQPNAIVNGTNPMFQWVGVAGASSYELAVDDLTTGQNNVLDVTGLTSTSDLVAGSFPDGQYQVRVRATVGGQTTGWSPTRAFELIGTPGPVASAGTPAQVDSSASGTAVGSTDSIATVADGQGNYLVAYVKQVGSNYQLFGRLFTANGTARGSEFPISSGLSQSSQIHAAMNATGNFVVSWTEPAAGNVLDIWAATFHADGSLNGAPAIVAVTGAGTPSYAIATTSSGKFVVVFTETQDTNLQAILYGANLSVLTGPIAVNISNGGDGFAGAACTQPDVKMDASGNFYVVWRSTQLSASGSSPRIFLRDFDASGNPTTAEVPVDPGLAPSQVGSAYDVEAPTIAQGPGGTLAVLWSNSINNANFDLYARFLSSDGTFAKAEFLVAPGGGTNFQAAIDAHNNLFVTWAGNNGTQAAVFTPSEDPYGASFTLLPGPPLQTLTYIPGQGTFVGTYVGAQAGSPAVFAQALGYIPATGFGLGTVNVHIGTTFTHTFPLLAPDAGPYTVSVNWGDGNIGTDTVLNPTTASIAHFYAALGTYHVTVTLHTGSGPAVTESFTVNVTNNAPMLVSGTDTLPGIPFNATNPPGVTVASFADSGITDIDGDPKGIAIVSTTGNGTWQYSLNGTSWTAITVSNASALLLRDTDQVRFVPTTGFAGTATFVFRAWDQTSGTDGGTANLSSPSAVGGSTAFSGSTATASVTVAAPTITFTPSTLPAASFGVFYQQALTLNGGTAPYNTFALGSGTLPGGISIDPSNGTISGTPTADGTFNFTITARDSSAGGPFTATSQTYTLTVTGLTISPNTAALSPGQQSVAYNQPITATGGSGVYTFSATGLPAGLSINANTGVISGTPTVNGSFPITVQVHDSGTGNNQQTGSKAYTLVISPAQLTITTTSLASWTAGAANYQQTIATTGGSGTITFSLQAGSTLPAGLALSAAGVITGTPTSVGTKTFTVQATDGQHPTTKQLTITINAPLNITPASPLAATAGSAYNQTLTVSQGTTPYMGITVTNFSAGGTGLTAGAFSTSAAAGTVTISGTPTSAGTATFTVNVTDSVGATLSRNYTLNVSATAPLTITTTSLPGGVAGTPGYSQTVATSGGSGTITFGVANGSTLPPGLGLNTSTGTISGTPSTAGTFSFTISATDSQRTVSQSYTVTFTPAGFVYNPGTQTLTITGTSGADWFVFGQSTTGPGGPVTYTFTLNGASVTYTDSQVKKVIVNGNGGADNALLYTQLYYTDNNNQLHEVLTREALTLGNGNNVLQKFDNSGNPTNFITLNSFVNFYSYMNTASAATLYDAAGQSNAFYSYATYSYLVGPGYFDFVWGPGSTTAIAQAGSQDATDQYDGIGASTFTLTGMASSEMTGTDYNNRPFDNKAVGFTVNVGFSQHAGDTAIIFDSPFNDVFTANPGYVTMYALNSAFQAIYSDALSGFTNVNAFSFIGGLDTATNNDPGHVRVSGFGVRH